MRRLVSVLLILLASLVLMGQSYDSYTYKAETYTGTSYNGATYSLSTSDVPDSSGIGPIWATLTTNGSAPTVYYAIDYDPNLTNEAIYVEILEGPNHTGNGMAMSWQYGDSTAGTGQGPHTSIVPIDSVAWSGDSLRVVISTWMHPEDTLNETVVDTIVLQETVDTTPPTIDVSPTIALTYQGNGDTLSVSYTGGTFSESCTKALIVTYASSYPSYGTEDAHWLYKTASAGVDSAVTVSPLAKPTYIVGRAYHSDTLTVAVQAIDLAGNRSALDTIYDATIYMPLGTIPTPDHDSYGIASIEYGGEPPGSGTVTKWGGSEVILMSSGMLEGTDSHDAAGYGDQWLARARTLGGKNFAAMSHTGITGLDTDAQFFKQRKFRLFKTLYDSMVALGHADTMVLAHDVDDSLCVPQNGGPWNSDRVLLVNILNTTARDTFADLIANEWNHSDNRLAYTGFFFDAVSYNNDFPLFSITTPATPTTVVAASTIRDNDNDGAALGSDLNEQQAQRTAWIALMDSVRASIAETSHDTINNYFLLGVNSDIHFVDSLALAGIDMIQIEDFVCPPSSGNPFISAEDTYYPYHNAADSSWVRTYFTANDSLPGNGDLPAPAGFTSMLDSVVNYMRSAAGGPYVVLEGGDAADMRDPRMIEAYSLLFDNVYPTWTRYPEGLTSWGRSYSHPDEDLYSDLSAIGAASGPAEVDSNGTTWTISRTFANGSVQVQLANRTGYDCETDSLAYAVVVGGDSLRLSDDFDDTIDFTAPIGVSFLISTPDSIGDSLSYYWEVDGASAEDTLAIETEFQTKPIGWTGFEPGVSGSYPVTGGIVSSEYQTNLDLDDLTAGDSIMVRIRAADYPDLNYTAWDTTLAVFARATPVDETAPTVLAHSAAWDSTTQAGSLVTFFFTAEANEDAYHRAAAIIGTDTTWGAWTDTLVASGDSIYWTIENDSTPAQTTGREYYLAAWAKDAADNVSAAVKDSVTISRATPAGGDTVTVFFSNSSTAYTITTPAASYAAATDGDSCALTNGQAFMFWVPADSSTGNGQYTRTLDWRLDGDDSVPPFDPGDNTEAGGIFFNVADSLTGGTIVSADLYLYAASTETDTGDTLVVVGLTAAGLDDYTGTEWNATYQYFDVSGTQSWSPHISTYGTYAAMGDNLVREPTVWTSGDWISLDVTLSVQDWVTDGDAEGGFLVLLEGSDTINIECPRDECAAGTRPYLVVKAVKP